MDGQSASDESAREATRVYANARAELVAVLTSVVRDEACAEEIAQEAGLRLMTSAHDPVRNPRALLFAIAMNLARDRLRRARTRDEHARSVSCEPESVHPSAEQAYDEHAALNRIGRALELLTPKARRVMWLSRVEGYTNAEVADALSLSIKSVEKHLQRGLAKLVRVLEPGPERDRR